MENLINESELSTYKDPVAEYEQMREELRKGNADVIARFGAGEYRELERAYIAHRNNPQSSVVAQNEEEPTDTASQHTSDVVEAPVEADPDEVPVDPLTESRRLFDLEQARLEEEKEQIRRTLEAELEAERIAKERLLKELDDERKRAEQLAKSAYTDDEGSELLGMLTNGVETPASEKQNNYADLPPEVKARLDRVEQIERQLAEKQEWDDTVRTYSKFFNSSEGSQFKPDGDIDSVMREFNGFFGDLVEGLGNDKDAFRLMHDIRKLGKDSVADKLSKTGLEVPKQFEKIYDAFEVALFADGYTLDPVLGRKIPHNKGKFANLEDAYYILNKDALRQKEKLEAFKTVQNKLRQRESAAVTVDPSAYRQADGGQSKFLNRDYRVALMTRARDAGWKGDSNISSITDPDLRNEMSQLLATLK